MRIAALTNYQSFFDTQKQREGVSTRVPDGEQECISPISKAY